MKKQLVTVCPFDSSTSCCVLWYCGICDGMVLHMESMVWVWHWYYVALFCEAEYDMLEHNMEYGVVWGRSMVCCKLLERYFAEMAECHILQILQ